MRLPALLAALAVCACASQLTQGGAVVRAVQPERAATCRALGPVEASQANGASAAENEAGALERVRNRIAQLGGNAYVVTSRASSAWRSVVQADAYRCAAFEPVPGLAPR